MNLNQFSHFPRRKKLAILRKIVINALVQYEIQVKRISFYAEHSNVLYKVQDQRGEMYMMKVVRPGDMSYEQLTAYLTWLDTLHNTNPDLPILRIKPTKNSGFIATVDMEYSGVRHCCLFRWIPGVNLRQRVSRPNAFKWGKLLATIHNNSQECALPITKTLRRWDKVFYWDEEVIFSKKYQQLMPGKRRSIFQKTVQKVQNAICKLHDHSQPMIIHGDLHLDNVRIDRGKMYALDFEDCMWGYPIQDIAIALLYIRFRPNYQELFEKFKEGYSSLRTWPQQYPGEIETFFMGRLLMFANILIKVDDIEDDEEDIEERLQRYQEEFTAFLEFSQ